MLKTTKKRPSAVRLALALLTTVFARFGGSSISATTALDPLLDSLISRLREVMNVERVAIFIEDEFAPSGYRVARTAGLSDLTTPPDFRDMIRTRSAETGVVRADDLELPAETGRNPLGKTSPRWEMNTKPLPSLMPLGARPMPSDALTPIMVANGVLGMLADSATVQVLAREPAGNWYQIIYDAGEGGRGWIAAQYVRLPDQAVVPNTGGQPMASVREQINVRSGPGADSIWSRRASTLTSAS